MRHTNRSNINRRGRVHDVTHVTPANTLVSGGAGSTPAITNVAGGSHQRMTIPRETQINDDGTNVITNFARSDSRK